ncbi:MAG: phospholipid carrier-dependent glycosyltransferase [Aggregatilineales bacterium]
MTRSLTLSRLRDALWLILMAAYIIGGTAADANIVPFHGDESTTIWMSRDFDFIVNQRNLDLVRYQDPPLNETEQQLRFAAAPLTKYAFGLAWTLNGYSLQDINDQWVWGAGWDYNQQTGHMPSDDLLMIARWTSTLFLAGSMVVLFFIGRKLGGAPVAYLATLYYTLNPAILLNGRRAMLEGTTIFFGLLVVLAGLWLLQNRNWASALLLGFAAGCAVAAKHPNIFIVVAVFVVCGGYAVYQSLSEDETADPDEFSPPTIGPSDPYNLITLLFVSGIMSLLLFFALNPVLWDEPADRISDMIQARSDILNTQLDVFGGYSDYGDQFAGFFRQVFIARPQYYEAPDWGNFISAQIHQYEQTIWRGVSIGGGTVGGLIVFALVVYGFWILLKESSTRRSTRWIVGIWGLVMFATTALITPLEWQRYYLSAMPAVALIGSLGFWTGIKRFYERNTRSNTPPI